MAGVANCNTNDYYEIGYPTLFHYEFNHVIIVFLKPTATSVSSCTKPYRSPIPFSELKWTHPIIFQVNARGSYRQR